MQWTRYLVCILLVLIPLQIILSTSQKSITNDELIHISAGYSYWKTYDFRLNPEHPPLVKLASAFPLLFLNPSLPKGPAWEESATKIEAQWDYGREFFFEANSNADMILFWARLFPIFLTTLLGFYVYLFSRDLWGEKGALVSLALFAFSPTLLAHGGLVTTDVGIAAFSVMLLYHLWRYWQNQNQRHLILCGIFFGFSLATKFTGLYHFFILPLLFLKGYLGHRDQVWEFWMSKKGLFHLRGLGIIIGIGIFVLILFYGVFEFEHFFRGVEDVIGHSRVGHPTYLHGEHSRQGWWYYFIVAFAVKTAIPTMIVILIALIVLPFTRKDLLTEAFLFVPILVFFCLFTINKINIGLRHILVIYPFLFIFSGRVAISEKKWLYSAVFFAIMWLMMESFFIFPHYLAYFNQFAGGPEKGGEWLIDSNIDWGQDLKGLDLYLEERNISPIHLAYFGKDSPEYRAINYTQLSCKPVSGIVGISVSYFVGFTEELRECSRWLDSQTPIARIGYSIFVYNISEEYYQSLYSGRLQLCQSSCQKSCDGVANATFDIALGKCGCNCVKSRV